MKKLLISLFLVGYMLGFTRTTKACIDYVNSIYVRGYYLDGTTDSDYIITVHNLELFGGPNGAFCTCGITSWTSVFDQITYVAIVDSGTFNPVESFAPWTLDQTASDAWESEAPWTNWDGYLAETVGTMTTGTPVEMVIRGTFPPPPNPLPVWNEDSIQSAITNSFFGTDEWSVSGDSLANSHYQLVSLWSADSILVEGRSQSFFDSVDFQITNVQDLESSFFEVYPNPTSDNVYISFRKPSSSSGTIEIVSVLGKAVLRNDFQSGDRIIEVDLCEIDSGTYLVNIMVGDRRVSKRLVKT